MKIKTTMIEQEKIAREESGFLRWEMRHLTATEVARKRIDNTHGGPAWAGEISMQPNAIY